MHTIDQRILIPTPPDIIWSLISDIARNPDWQEDCRSVSFLTSRREGPGTRWRFTTEKGREAVAEIIAWYQGLGYEYNFIDGVPYRENKGRIRLQEIPEGTVVQWTFSYELGGPLGGVRNALGTSRQLENAMAASLKTLWRESNRLSASERDVVDAKSLIREAPDVEARSQYKPRHASALDEAAEAADSEAGAAAEGIGQAAAEAKPEVLPAIVIEADEPPITVEDTQPHPAVTDEAVSEPAASAEAVEAVDEVAEPEFLGDLSRFEPPVEEGDTQPTKSQEAITDEQIAAADSALAQDADEAVEPAPAEAQAEPVTAVVEQETAAADAPVSEPAAVAEVAAEAEAESDAELEVEQAADTVEEQTAADELAPQKKRSRRRRKKKHAPTPESEAQSEPEPELHAAPEASPEPEPEPQPEPQTQPEPAPVQQAAAPERELPPEDTAGKSIWEIFGVPRPAELDDIQPAAAAVEASTPAVEPAPVEAAPAAVSAPFSAELPQTVPVEFAPPRFGLRFRLRQSKTRLRRPR